MALQTPIPPGAPGHTKARFCRKCLAWKPPRAHHCNATGRCYLKMDHYCIWLNQSVGLLTYKAFLLFLFYTLAACIVACAALLPAGVRLVSRGNLAGRCVLAGWRAHAPLQCSFLVTCQSVEGVVTQRTRHRKAGLLFMSTVLTFSFSGALLAFLVLHYDMVAHNYTSVEALDYQLMRHHWPWDKGVKRNFEEVFGRRRNWRWLPLLSNDDREWMISQQTDASLQAFQFQLAEPAAQCAV